VGPLAPPVRAEDGDTAAAVVEGKPQSPNGRVVETSPAPITIPGGGGSLTPDPTIGGEPLFLPYAPPADTTELPAERTATSRTLANPDGTFTLEMSDGPINFQGADGNWQPIDLALVPEIEGGYRVAATAGTITVDTNANELGVIEVDGHRVALSAPGYAGDVLGSDVTGLELDANTVKFADALGTAAEIWVRPVDIGLEFGATWPDATKSAVVSFVLDPGDLAASVAKDGKTIVFTDEKGEFAGRISQPIVREGSEDGPPLLDPVTVALVELAEGGHLLEQAAAHDHLHDAEGRDRLRPAPRAHLRTIDDGRR
jgi:hypothetical protein